MLGGILLTLSISILSLLPQAVPGTLAKEIPEPSAQIGRPSYTSGEITVPFEYFKQHIYVAVRVNGTPGLIFMLDSGASKNVLNLRTARQLGMKTGSMKQEKDVGFGGGRIYTASEKDVHADIDSIPVAHVMSVMDLNAFERHFSHPTDGLLGYPFFKHFVVKVDFERKLLSLIPAERYSYRGLGVRMGLKPTKSFMVLPVILGNSKFTKHQVDVVVDTGSNITLTVYERYVHPLGLDSSLSHAQPAEAFGLNGYYPLQVGSVDFLQIGNAETRNLPVDYLAESNEIRPEPEITGAIGNGILQGFRAVIFDVPHRRMIFEVKRPYPLDGVTRIETAEP